MAIGSNVTIEIDSKKIPFMNKVMDLVKDYCLPSGAYSNEKYFEKYVNFSEGITGEVKLSLFDPLNFRGTFNFSRRVKAHKLLDTM